MTFLFIIVNYLVRVKFKRMDELFLFFLPATTLIIINLLLDDTEYMFCIVIMFIKLSSKHKEIFFVISFSYINKTKWIDTVASTTREGLFLPWSANEFWGLQWHFIFHISNPFILLCVLWFFSSIFFLFLPLCFLNSTI